MKSCVNFGGYVDEKSADRDFKVALNALLKVIEPHRGSKRTSYFHITETNNVPIESAMPQFEVTWTVSDYIWHLDYLNVRLKSSLNNY